MLHRIEKAIGRSDFTLEVVFEEGERAVVDLSSFVADGQVTERMRAEAVFFVSAVRVLEDGDGIGWPNDVEIDADALWYKAHPDDWERDYGNATRTTSTG